MLDEMVNGVKTPVEYRIVAVELDGSIKVMRNEVLKSGNGNLEIPYDSNNTGNDQGTTGSRQLTSGSYCNYSSNGKYYGCNAWSKMTGIINGLNDGAGLVSIDSEMKTYLNTTFYETLAESTKNAIVTHSFNLVGSSYSSVAGTGWTEKDLYDKGKTANTWVGKIGLIEIRDWFNAAEICNPGDGGGYYKSGTQPTYTCKNANYMYLNVSWWTITPNLGNRYDVFFVNSSGYARNNYAYNRYAVRPVFFLSSNIELTGKGTKGANAYKIK